MDPAGALSVLFGIVVCFEPVTGIVFLVYTFAFFMMLTGISFIGVSLRLRRLTTARSCGLNLRRRIR